MTATPNEMSDEELYQSITDICFENGGVTKPMADKLMLLIKQHREAYATEAKLDFANDMLKMNKWNERARTDELYKIIRQLRKKVGQDHNK